MKRIAFTLIGGYGWLGGYNYQVNLIKALLQHEKARVTPCLFLGLDTDERIVRRFRSIKGLELTQSAVFNKKNAITRLIQAIVLGVDRKALSVFETHQIDVVFEVANFYGWRFPISAIAWIPDLQHRELKHLFSFFSYWKREFGFQAQIRSNRQIMLSSQDAKNALESFYPRSVHGAKVVSFAVPPVECKLDLVKLRHDYALPEHFFFLPNQFWKHKNHECVVKALNIAKSQGHEIVVATTGNPKALADTSHFEQLNALVETLDLNDNFRMLGVIPYEHIVGLMLCADALINPSLFEGWSTTVEESKSLGVKMLLSSLDVHQEQASEYASFFDPNSPVDLANLLIGFQGLQEDERLSFRHRAKIEAASRVEVFANAFANLVESCTSQ